MSGLTLQEKVSLLTGDSLWTVKGVPRLGLPTIVLTDGPHGVRLMKGDPAEVGKIDEREPATCFPTASALAATWDLELLETVGRAIAEEARALGVSVVLGPGLNLKRSPVCGRNFEYYSEDPLLSGRLAAAWVRGAQSTGVAACLKHFAANNQEHRRSYVDARVDPRALRELYLASFELALREGRPLSVMAAYNRLEGTYCAEHPWLLTKLLRDEWGFDGVVMSDWGAVDDKVESLSAGCDLEMPGWAGRADDEVLHAVESGRLPVAVVNRASNRVAKLIERTAKAREAQAPVNLDVHHELARRVAAEATVLLKNEGAILPIAPETRVAVIGAFAETPRYQGAGSSEITPTRLDDALTSLRARIPSLSYAPGYGRHAEKRDKSLEQEACDRARAADVAILFVGLTEAYETEGRDRAHLKLPPAHDSLVRAVAAVNPRVIVVLSNGAPVELPWHDEVAAILEAGLGGQAGGSALADVLLGDREPAGRLAETYPVRFEDHPAASLPNGPAVVEYRESLFVGYRFFDTANAAVRFPFGFGLSYTSFTWTDAEASATDYRDGGQLTVSVTVRNDGARAGSEVVQLYVHPLAPRAFRPAHELKAFAKVTLEPGESTRVTLTLDRRAFATWDEAQQRWAVEPGTYGLRLGRHSRDVQARILVDVTSDAPPREAEVPPVYRHVHDPKHFTAEAFAALYPRQLPPNLVERHGAFTLNTPLADMHASPIARLLHKRLYVEAARVLGRPLEELPPIVTSTLDEASLRSFRLLAQGRVPRTVLEAVLELMNGRPAMTAWRLLRALFP